MKKRNLLATVIRAARFQVRRLAPAVLVASLLLVLSVQAQPDPPVDSKPDIEGATGDVVSMDGAAKLLAGAPSRRSTPVSVLELVVPATPDVRLDAPDLSAVLVEDETLLREHQVRRIGIVRALPVRASASGGSSPAGQWIDLPAGGSLWLLTLESEGAKAIRAHLEDLSLPQGAQIMVYNTLDPREAYGPYDAGYLQGRTDLWAESVFGATVTVELYLPAGVDRGQAAVQVREIGHVYRSLAVPRAPTLLTCHNDVTCYASWANEADSVAGLGTVGTAGVLWCTGSLMIDQDPETWEDYFMTANHCLSGSNSVLGTQTDANTIEFYWFYQTPTCNGTPPNPATVARTGGGADLISAQTKDAGNDHAFLRIRNVTPGGVFYEGWTTGSPGSSDTLTGIHHPDGSYKRLSSGTLDTSDTNYWTVEYSSGATEGGSSGSPLYDASKRFIGQLWGDTKQCPPNARSVYGRFNVTWPHIRRWMEIGGTIHVDWAYSGAEEGTPTQPFDTVGEANNFSWNGVRIKIAAGSYPETLTFSREMTVLADGGTVTIGP